MTVSGTFLNAFLKAMFKTLFPISLTWRQFLG